MVSKDLKFSGEYIIHNFLLGTKAMKETIATYVKTKEEKELHRQGVYSQDRTRASLGLMPFSVYL